MQITEGLSLGAGSFEPRADDVRRRARAANIGDGEGLRQWPPRAGEGAHLLHGDNQT